MYDIVNPLFRYYYNVAPPSAISWFIDPNNYRYIYHKPYLT